VPVPVTLGSIRPALEGAIPAVIATCARDGTPNVSYVSEVHYVDEGHVALSFQFFSKTRQNVLENPRATVIVIHPATGAQYRLALRYERTEESGALFECMKAKLAGIASQTGMTGVFRLRGADVYRVDTVAEVYGTPIVPDSPAADYVGQLRRAVTRLAGAPDLSTLFDVLLDCVCGDLGISHAMVLMSDTVGDRLYTVASRGYAESGVGAEIRSGDGIIGAAARARTPIRISHATSEFGYGRAARVAAERRGLADRLAEEIPFPGLAESQSQIAVPMLAGNRLVGVLFAESTTTGKFGYGRRTPCASSPPWWRTRRTCTRRNPSRRSRSRARLERRQVRPGRRCACAATRRTTASSWTRNTSSRAWPARSSGGWCRATCRSGGPTTRTVSCGSIQRSGSRT